MAKAKNPQPTVPPPSGIVNASWEVSGGPTNPITGKVQPPARLTPNASMSPINAQSGASTAPVPPLPPGAGRRSRPQGHPGNVPQGGRPEKVGPGRAIATGGLRHNIPASIPQNPNAGALRSSPDASESQYANWRPQPPAPYIRDVDLGENFFSPFQPIFPFASTRVPPRTWDYPVGVNLEIHRRQAVYQFLRNLVTAGEGVLAPVIEARKDQLLRVPYDFQLIDKPDNATDSRLKELRAFFKSPDATHAPDGTVTSQGHDFQTWARIALHDRFVIDATTFLPWRRNNGKPFRIDVIDGATILPLVDDAGRIPDPPNPAYQQIVKGLPMLELTKDELLYAPHNPFSYAPIVGFSEVQQIALRMTSAVRKELYVFSSWEDGNIPDLIMGTPEDWTPQQVAEMQAFFDDLLSGNLALRTKMRLVPGGVKPILSKGTTAEILAALKTFEEQTARIICFAFSIPPTSFVSMMNRATAAQLADEAQQEGLYPLMNWFKAIMDFMVQNWFGYKDIEFNWQVQADTDKLKESQTLIGYVKSAIMKPNEARDILELPPDPDGGTLMVVAGQGAIPLKLLANQTELPTKAAPQAVQAPNGGLGQPAKKPLQIAPPKPAATGAKAPATGKPANSPPAKKALTSPDDAPRADFVKVGRWLLPANELY